ncbi:MAG: hypothetical protein KF823_11625 [Xanthomonadales bacterium]|nr:hypothetical protein [Xanthomonadales bacterium]
MTVPPPAALPRRRPHLRTPALAALALSAALVCAAQAEDDDAREERIWAVASALATADAVREHCPMLKVDAEIEARLIASTGLDRAALSAHESYQDQAAAEAWVRSYAGERAWLACDTAMSAHEDIAPGLVKRRR